jgi:hypothetical protein
MKPYYELYGCTRCKGQFPPTTEYFYASLLRNLEGPEKTSLGQCKVCAVAYAAQYNSKRTEKKKARAGNWFDKTSMGKLYVIGVDDLNPLKIGVVTGTTIEKRKTALQTSHWLDLKVFYESPVINNPLVVERMLHEKYHDKKLRGEWFDIRLSEVEKIKNLVDPHQKKNSNP